MKEIHSVENITKLLQIQINIENEEKYSFRFSINQFPILGYNNTQITGPCQKRLYVPA